jgi:nuclear pore complex protein Nup53
MPPLNSADAPSHAPSSQAPPILIFGFNAALVDPIIAHFGQLGEIVDYTPAPEGGNWVSVTYREAWCAARAVRRNGEIIGGKLMIGVKWAEGEPASLVTPSASPAIGAAPEIDRTETPSGMSRSSATSSLIAAAPIGVMPSGSAFRKAAPRHKKSYSLFNADDTPHARLFADTDKALQHAKPQQQSSTWTSRFSELVFGS